MKVFFHHLYSQISPLSCRTREDADYGCVYTEKDACDVVRSAGVVLSQVLAVFDESNNNLHMSVKEKPGIVVGDGIVVIRDVWDLTPERVTPGLQVRELSGNDG